MGVTVIVEVLSKKLSWPKKFFTSKSYMKSSVQNSIELVKLNLEILAVII